jgi:hypothetical protein
MPSPLTDVPLVPPDQSGSRRPESQGPSLLINDSKLMTALAFIVDKVDVLSNSSLVYPIVFGRS